MEEQTPPQDPEKEQEQDKLFIEGFNNGYLLSKHEPTLAAQLTSQENNHSDYFLGLVSGKDEYEREMREWAKSFSRGAPAKDERNLGKER